MESSAERTRDWVQIETSSWASSSTKQAVLYDAESAWAFVEYFRLDEVPGWTTPGAYGKWADEFEHLADSTDEWHERLCLASMAIDIMLLKTSGGLSSSTFRRKVLFFIANLYEDAIIYDCVDKDARLINPAVERVDYHSSPLDIMKLVLTVFSGDMATLSAWGPKDNH